MEERLNMVSLQDEVVIGDESQLTTVQKEVLVELQKVLLTLNMINQSLLSIISQKDATVASQKAAIEKAKRVLSDALGIQEKEPVSDDDKVDEDDE